ncbi:MAG: OmpH family outer membrane protein [Candidatus Bipolaricaulis sp.]|nr:OmpH family outer membrane protein [Candidatus Bipolaricaulis sp.]
MSRSTLIVAAVALVLAAGALILQFALPSGGDGGSQSEIAALRADVSALQRGGSTGGGLKIAYLNAEEAFTVFTNAVSNLRQKALDKRNEIVKLQSDFMQSTISKEQYQRRLNELNVELIDAQLDIDVGTIDRMIASDGFSDIRADLQKLRDAAQPVVEEVKNLVATAKLGVVDSTEFQSRLSQVQSAFQQLDTLLTQAATLKIQQAAKKIAIQRGYDLVLPTKNVIVYADTSAIPDITEQVKAEIANYL